MGSRRCARAIELGLGACLLLAPTALQAQPSGPPNILLIVADDLGWVDLATAATSQGNGSAYHETPNLDRLASEGMSFTSAYAQQNCTPTRAMLLTGQYAPRNGVHNVGSLNRAGDDTLLVGPEDGEAVRAEATTVAEVLRSAGYVTAHVGKFHATASAADIVNVHGFDFNYGGTSSNAPGYFASAGAGGWQFLGVSGLDVWAGPYTQEYVDENLKPWATGNDADSLVGTPKHLSDALADAAIAFMGSQLGSSQPFFLNLAFKAVHAPIEPRPDLLAKFKSKATADPRHGSASYAALLEGMDQAIGRVLAFLGDPDRDGDPSDGIAEETLVVFTSDNGGAWQHTSNAPLRGDKAMLTEGGLRVPLIARMPGTIAAGAISDALVHGIDLYPTFAELAGAALPDPAVHALDGESLVGVLTGAQAELEREAVFWHFPGYQGRGTGPTSLITKRVGARHHKLVYTYEDARYELYDLTGDPGETTDLLAGGRLDGAGCALARQMGQELVDWLADVGAVLPTVRATGETAPILLDALDACGAGGPALYLDPTEGFTVRAGEGTLVRVTLVEGGAPLTGAEVGVGATGEGAPLAARDDGADPDAVTGDGIYTAAWTPAAAGPATLSASAAWSGGSVSGSVAGEVIEIARYAFRSDPPFDWIDASEGASVGAVLADDGSFEIPIGFPFRFYGRIHDALHISANGLLGFEHDRGASHRNRALPSAWAPNAVIAPYWDDLDPSAGGSVSYLLAGEAPSRSLTVEWNGVPYYDAPGSATFQVTLLEDGGEIRFQYLDVASGGVGHGLGASATVGIEDPTGTLGLEHSFDGPAVSGGMAIAIVGEVGCPDGDGDGVCDESDNCLEIANPDQRDTNGDGYGNRCDADYTGDGWVGAPDLPIFRAALGAWEGQPGYDPDVDHDGDGAIGASDLAQFKQAFGGSAGPSGLACAGSVPCPLP